MYSKRIDKQVLVGFPSSLHAMVKEAAAKKFMSVSAFIRNCVLEKVDEELSENDILLIEKGLKEAKQGKTREISDTIKNRKEI